MRPTEKIATLMLLTIAVLCTACGTTNNGDEGVTLERAQVEANLNLFPPCPQLPDDPVVAKEIVIAWLAALKEIAPSLPATVHQEIRAEIDRSLTGTVSPVTDVTSQIEAVLEGLK